VVLAADPGREREAAVRLGRIGFDGVLGYLDPPVESLDAEALASTERVTPEELARDLEAGRPVTLLDVRNPSELEDCRLPGVLNLPLARLPETWRDLPRDRPVVAICRSGYRSSLAVSWLLARGFPRIGDLRGGMTAWNAVPAERR
jgi:rhodanese-related sulfurtransferase